MNHNVSGWRKANPDLRDNQYKLINRIGYTHQLPLEVDHRPLFPNPYDQGKIGSCGPNALAGLIESFHVKTKYPFPFTPSRLFIYYNTRVLQNTVMSDSGVDNRTLLKAVVEDGVCPESQPDGKTESWYWSYSDDWLRYREHPHFKCYTDAKIHFVEKYEWIDLSRAAVLSALAAGHDFLVGFTVYESFRAIGADGVMPIPQTGEAVLGGHDIVVLGYMLNHPMGNQGVKDWVICRNSWGTEWGDHGHFYMPLDEVLCNPSIASDALAVDFVGHKDHDAAK